MRQDSGAGVGTLAIETNLPALRGTSMLKRDEAVVLGVCGLSQARFRIDRRIGQLLVSRYALPAADSNPEEHVERRAQK